MIEGPSGIGNRCGAIVVLAVTAAVVSGCGGTSPQDSVKSTFNKFVSERAKGDPAACDLLSQGFVKQQTGKGYAAGVQICRQRAGASKLAIPKSLKVDKVTVKGNTASLTASIPGQGSATFGFVMEGGSWKVNTSGA